MLASFCLFQETWYRSPWLNTQPKGNLMREVVGSFAQLKNVRSIIKEESRIHQRRRQVVNVLLISPNGRALCLCVAEGAIKDQRLNLCPPQGGIELHESINNAAIREVAEEVAVAVVGKIIYLGSMIRDLPSDHRHAVQFDDCHHHWVAAFSSSYDLQPKPPQVVAKWHYFKTLEDSTQTPMSKDKARMFNAARAKLVSICGDPLLVRQELFGINSAGVSKVA